VNHVTLVKRYKLWLLLAMLSLALLALCSKLGSPTFGLIDIGRSGSIDESKNRGVFVAEYDISPQVIIVNDRCTLCLTDAWLERQWKPGFFDSITVTYSNQYCELLWRNSGTHRDSMSYADQLIYFPVIIEGGHGVNYYKRRYNDAVGSPPKKMYQYAVVIGRGGEFRWSAHDTVAIVTFTAKDSLPQR